MGSGDLTDVERPKIGDDIYQHPHRPQLPVMDPQDGMPRAISPLSMEDSKAPSLDPETFVCMAQDEEFVIRDYWGDILVRVHAFLVRRKLSEDGSEDWLAPLTQEQHKAAGEPIALTGGKDFLYGVEPLRPQCQHYKRVMTDFENTDSKGVERVCTAQRTDSGEFLSLRDQRVYACEHRSPRDFVSEERLRKFDERAMALAKKPDEEWDGEAAL